ncbi:hypothetical protein [Paenibacillus sp. LjRoot56]|uniref:hypothetical protein n=1 Tax=Paenibacillus sp. LjRoot56 TaxID=3342333 RepID=UPI003ECC3D85
MPITTFSTDFRNIAHTSINAATPASGKLYYDDVKAEASNQSLGPVVFTLKSNKFASWWNLGDPVVYQLNAGAVASSVNTIIGGAYNSDNKLVAQVPVSRQAGAGRLQSRGITKLLLRINRTVLQN